MNPIEARSIGPTDDGSALVGDFEVQYWLAPEQIRAVGYSEYWNDENKERDKPLAADGDFPKMERFLRELGLDAQLDAAIRFCRDRLGRPLRGAGADLAAGVLWAVPRLLRVGDVVRVYCVEYSVHRLLKIGPTVLRHYGVPRDRVVLCLGSFYDLKLPDHALQFVVLAQAFHHAEHPQRLLAEIRRVLAPDGVVIIIGEHKVDRDSLRAYGKRLVKAVLAVCVPKSLQQRLFGRVFRLATIAAESAGAPDPETGDHYYSDREYTAMFFEHGFTHYPIEGEAPQLRAFVLTTTSEDSR